MTRVSQLWDQIETLDFCEDIEGNRPPDDYNEEDDDKVKYSDEDEDNYKEDNNGFHNDIKDILILHAILSRFAPTHAGLHKLAQIWANLHRFTYFCVFSSCATMQKFQLLDR